MDVFDPDELEVKRILVDLEDEHRHLQVSIGHLEHEIQKREVEIQRLLAERELDLAKSRNQDKPILEAKQRQDRPQFSSDFTKQVAFLLDRIQKTSEQVCELVKL